MNYIQCMSMYIYVGKKIWNDFDKTPFYYIES